MPERKIKHEQYKGHDIRSEPSEVERKEKKGWKVRLNITFPVHGTGTMEELFEENEPLYPSLTDAHTAGFKFGRRIIDEKIHWTTELPTASGYYWWRELGHKEAFIVEVNIERQTVSSRDTDDAASLDEMDGEWCGPLEPPG